MPFRPLVLAIVLAFGIPHDRLRPTPDFDRWRDAGHRHPAVRLRIRRCQARAGRGRSPTGIGHPGHRRQRGDARECRAQMDKVMAAIRAAGIARRDIPDQRHQPQPELPQYVERRRPSSATRPTTRSTSGCATCPSSAGAGHLRRTGRQPVNGPSFEVDKPDGATTTGARRRAQEGAGARQDLRRALGLKVRQIVSITEAAPASTADAMMRAMAAVAGFAKGNLGIAGRKHTRCRSRRVVFGLRRLARRRSRPRDAAPVRAFLTNATHCRLSAGRGRSSSAGCRTPAHGAALKRAIRRRPTAVPSARCMVRVLTSHPDGSTMVPRARPPCPAPPAALQTRRKPRWIPRRILTIGSRDRGELTGLRHADDAAVDAPPPLKLHRRRAAIATVLDSANSQKPESRDRRKGQAGYRSIPGHRKRQSRQTRSRNRLPRDRDRQRQRAMPTASDNTGDTDALEIATAGPTAIPNSDTGSARPSYPRAAPCSSLADRHRCCCGCWSAIDGRPLEVRVAQAAAIASWTGRARYRMLSSAGASSRRRRNGLAVRAIGMVPIVFALAD